MAKVKEPAPHVKAAQIEKEAVRALSVDEVEEALTKSTYGGEKKVHDLESDIEILKTECINLQDDLRVAVAAKTTAQRQLDEAKKTISKMKYAHEEEVRALEDELAESKILNKKAGEYSSMLDADSDSFENILDLAHVLGSLSKSMYALSKRIEKETEGRV